MKRQTSRAFNENVLARSDYHDLAACRQTQTYYASHSSFDMRHRAGVQFAFMRTSELNPCPAGRTTKSEFSGLAQLTEHHMEHTWPEEHHAPGYCSELQ